MSTIGSASSGYYQLANFGSGTSSATTSASSSGLAALENLLGGSTSSGSGSSYLLNLSPAAQQYLNSGSSNSSGNFILSATQQTAINNILLKYKDSPQDQDTFDKIQADLQAAGLSPQTLGMMDQTQSFNPTSVLLSALNGNYTSLNNSSQTSSSDEQTKMNTYLQNVVTQWKNESSSTSSASGASS